MPCPVGSGIDGSLLAIHYGSHINAMAVYQNNYQFVPLERVRDFFEDIFDRRPTKAIILQANATCTENIKPANDAIFEVC